jgi:hypothetical protein
MFVYSVEDSKTVSSDKEARRKAQANEGRSREKREGRGRREAKGY